MCMKNVNTDVVLFNGVLPNEVEGKNINLLGVSKGIPTVHAKKVEEGLLSIPKLDILLSISATERTDANKDPVHVGSETSANTFFMDERYKIRLRVTETHSGKFVDLDTINIDPSQQMITLCRRIYNQRSVYQYRNVLVVTPPEGKDLCALKVLIQCETAPDQWIVQSMHPMRLIVKNS